MVYEPAELAVKYDFQGTENYFNITSAVIGLYKVTITDVILTSRAGRKI
jgi:hypothetical protein